MCKKIYCTRTWTRPRCWSGDGCRPSIGAKSGLAPDLHRVRYVEAVCKRIIIQRNGIHGHKRQKKSRDRVVLVGLSSPVLKQDGERRRDHHGGAGSALVETAGAETVGMVLQNRASPDPRTFIGEGKVAEVQLYCGEHRGHHGDL